MPDLPASASIPPPTPFFPSSSILSQTPRPASQGLPSPLRQTSGNTPGKHPEHNQERMIAPRVGKPSITPWDKFSEQETYKDYLHTKSYTKDQSVVEPGQEPSAPLYGSSAELQISGGDATPTIYVQRQTPTDYKQKSVEAQSYRNHILEREFKCPICGISFPAYESEQTEKHITEHQQTLAADGECAWCGDNNWLYMTMDERRAHLAHHHKSEELQFINKFWAETRCPACNQDFEGWRSADIILHCINKHHPGDVQFCSKCGVNEFEFSDREKAHHQRVCLRKRDQPHGHSQEPNFCRQCGKDMNGQDQQAEMLHNRDCKSQGEWHHETCGLLMDSLTNDEVSKHYAACKPPNGWKGKYCQRCGQCLFDMNSSAFKIHDEECWKRVEPHRTPIEEQIEGIFIPDKIHAPLTLPSFSFTLLKPLPKLIYLA